MPDARSTWRPHSQVAKITLSDADKARLRSQQLAGVARQFGIKEPPDVALVRWTNLAEFPHVLVDCLNQAGWDARLTPDNGVLTPEDLSVAQQSAYFLAYYTCQAQYSMDPKYNVPFSKDQLGLIYDYKVEILAPCITAQGFEPEPAPSRASFIASGGSDWNVYPDSLVRDTARYGAVLKACPSNPPDEFLYG